MADIFDEIDEDLKRDQMQMLWARYGKIVMAVVAAIILLVGARQGYTAWQSNQSEASATAYEQALKSDDIIGALEAQRGQLTDGYAMLAQFQIAAAQAAANDFEAAEASYMGIAADSSFDPLYQQVATTPFIHTGIFKKDRKQLLDSYPIRIRTTLFSGLKGI